jgi:hypothetical protein
VGEDKGCLVGDIDATGELQCRHPLGGIDEERDRTPRRSTKASLREAKIVPLVRLN